MTAMVITCNTVLTSRACSFLTLYFLQMFYYIYINTFIHSTVIPWSETEIKSLTLSLNAKNFGKDEKSRDQSRQVNNYKANAYKGGDHSGAQVISNYLGFRGGSVSNASRILLSLQSSTFRKDIGKTIS